MDYFFAQVRALLKTRPETASSWIAWQNYILIFDWAGGVCPSSSVQGVAVDDSNEVHPNQVETSFVVHSNEVEALNFDAEVTAHLPLDSCQIMLATLVYAQEKKK